MKNRIILYKGTLEELNKEFFNLFCDHPSRRSIALYSKWKDLDSSESAFRDSLKAKGIDGVVEYKIDNTSGKYVLEGIPIKVDEEKMNGTQTNKNEIVDFLPSAWKKVFTD